VQPTALVLRAPAEGHDILSVLLLVPVAVLVAAHDVHDPRAPRHPPLAEKLGLPVEQARARRGARHEPRPLLRDGPAGGNARLSTQAVTRRAFLLDPRVGGHDKDAAQHLEALPLELFFGLDHDGHVSRVYRVERAPEKQHSRSAGHFCVEQA